jgi:membrane carboxypeptidase/penicillin-binding protein PbpC
MAANAFCPTKQHEWVAAEAHPLPCSWHHLSDEGLLTYVPPQYQVASDASDTARPISASRVARATLTNRASSLPAFRIASPPEGATYLIDPTLRREFQTLPLRVVTGGTGPIEWSVNGDRIGATASDEPLAWPLTKGDHHFVARDGNGQRAEATITVR